MALPENERFLLCVNTDGPIMRPDLGPCHPWTGSCAKKTGYGWFSGFGERKAHRAAYAREHGCVPEGKHVLHHCDNPPCVKARADALGPAHLYAGTHQRNMADAVDRGRLLGINAGDRNGMRTHPGLSAGERNGQAKLSDADVLVIRAARAAGERQTVLAAQFDVHPTTIYRIVHGRSRGQLVDS